LISSKMVLFILVNCDKYMFMIFLWSSDKIKKVFDVSYFKKLNSNLLISFIFDLSAKPEFSEKKFFNVILKFPTFPPYKKPRDQ
jgi:hypothetical protein